MTAPSLRPVDPEADLEIATRLARACEEQLVGWSDTTTDSMRSMLTGSDAWPQEARLAVLDGEPVGLLLVERLDAAREVFMDAYAVGPRAEELLRLLVGQGLGAGRRAEERDPAPGPVDDPYEPGPGVWQVAAGAYAQDAVYRRVLADAGMREVRRFWRMHRDLDGVGPTEPPPPPGVDRRTATGPDYRLLVHRLFDVSFAEHYGHVDRPAEDWLAGVESSPGVDPDRWWIATLDGEPVGLCLLDDSRAEFDEGYVRTLGVVPQARGRGIARWLLACAAADAVRRGRRGIRLTVDGRNASGAIDLYRSAGYTVVEAIDKWCYPVLDARSDSASSR